MKKVVSSRVRSISKQLAFTSVFAALCCIGTVLIVIPLPTGYFNTGDVFVLLAGWCLGPLYGGIAAAVGSALADVISGYPLYAPATFIIKGVLAVIAFYVSALAKKAVSKEGLDFVPRVVSAIAGELFMVFGYFLFEFILYGFGGAVATLVGNGLQGLCCAPCAVVIISLLYPVKAVRNFFPYLRFPQTAKK